MTDLDHHARTHVALHGWNSFCSLVLDPTFRRWWSESGDALVGYAVSGRMAIAIGAPICEESRISSAVTEWCGKMRALGLVPCFFGAEARLKAALQEAPNFAQLRIGSQPEWNPRSFLQAYSRTPSLMGQVRRAERKGTHVREARAEDVQNDVRLRGLAQTWLASKRVALDGFLLDPTLLAVAGGRRVFVAERQGDAVGVLAAAPIPSRSGWLVERTIRHPKAPNGTTEALLHSFAETVASEGALHLTLGLVPFLQSSTPSGCEGPDWFQRTAKLAWEHGGFVYGARGQYEFKAKFQPDNWTDVWLIVNAPHIRPSHIRSIFRAFTSAPPEFVLLKGVVRAIGRRLTRHQPW